MKNLFRPAVIGAGLLAVTASAQVPGIITYQGRVTSGGTNFNGQGFFKFALVGPAGTNTFWSHDGTGAGGAAPGGQIGVPVSDGLFSVALGDTSIAGMQAIPASVFTNSDVRLRLWFNDGVNGFAGLSPDQRITAAGYALAAGTLPDGAVGTAQLANSAVIASKIPNATITANKLAPGVLSGTNLTAASIGAAQLADNAVTNPKLADAAVNTAELADSSVTTPKLANTAVTGPKIASGTITWTNLAAPSVRSDHLFDGVVTSNKLADGAITTPKIAAGSVTADKLAPGSIAGTNLAPNSVGSTQLANAVTFESINLGSVNWTGSLGLFVPPQGGGVVQPGGAPRARWVADQAGTDMTLFQFNGQTGAVFQTTASGGALRTWDSLGNALSLLGNGNGGGQFTVYQKVNGVPGVVIDGDEASYDNNVTAGGDVSVYTASGQVGLLLDGSHENAGRIEVRQANGTPYVDIFGRGEANAGEVWLKDSDGTRTVELRGQAGATQAGQMRLFTQNGRTNVILKAQAGSEQGASLQLMERTGIRTVLVDAQDGTGNSGRIELARGNGVNTFVLDAATSANTGAEMSLHKANGTATIELDAEWGEGGAGIVRLFRHQTGNETVSLNGSGSHGGGSVSLFDSRGSNTVSLVAAESATTGSQLLLRNASGTTTVELDGDVSNNGQGGGFLRLRRGDNTTGIALNAHAAGGARVTTQVLEITGGSDLSEQFDVSAGDHPVEPGLVVCIDPEHPGRLRPSHQAYDSTVVGVVSGAGGVSTGMLMGQAGSIADGQHPIALTGRVYCRATATGGAIKPGDLLTTSDEPGRAMKACDGSRTAGAVIGKAMTALPDGEGLVLVLVSLQ
jgi:hypothetical protein